MVADLGSVALVFEIREVVHLVDQPPCYHFVGDSGMWAAAGFGNGEEAGFGEEEAAGEVAPVGVKIGEEKVDGDLSAVAGNSNDFVDYSEDDRQDGYGDDSESGFEDDFEGDFEDDLENGQVDSSIDWKREAEEPVDCEHGAKVVVDCTDLVLEY